MQTCGDLVIGRLQEQLKNKYGADGLRHRDVNVSSLPCTISKIISRKTSLMKKPLHRTISLQWRHNGRDGVFNHQPHDYFLLNCLFKWRSKKTPKPRVTDLCEGNSPVTSEFPAQRTCNAENVSIWWRHHVKCMAAITRSFASHHS